MHAGLVFFAELLSHETVLLREASKELKPLAREANPNVGIKTWSLVIRCWRAKLGLPPITRNSKSHPICIGTDMRRRKLH